MTIYRGPGGSGDATNDATVTAVAAYAAQAATSATNAANSATTSGTSATNSANSASSAAASASAAATSASQAASSQSAAATSATTAANSATSAGTQATTATTQANNAANSATAAANSATSATNKAAEAETYAIRAETAETNAETAYSNTLAIYGDTTDVANAVASASTSASNAATSASQAAASSGTASDYATQAGISAGLAGNSASAAANSASNAATSANNAAAIYGGISAVNAAVTQSANSAAASSASSSSAQTSASNAATSATNSANSATQAAASAASAAAIVTNVSSNRPSVRPSLLLDFQYTKQLDPRITFSRPTTATYYDGKTTAVAEQNLLTYSQEFNQAGSWATAGRVSITANSTTAPDGTSTAETMTEVAATGTHRLEQIIAGLSPANTYTLSCFFKVASGSPYAALWLSDLSGNNQVRAWFKLSDGTLGSTQAVGSATVSSSTITSVGNGWYRCTVTGSPVGGAAPISAYVAMADADLGFSYAGDTGRAVFIWGAQLEQRSTATAYTPTTTAPITNYIPALQTAVSNDARFDHDPVTGESKGLLIEEQRTNLLTYSSEFDNAYWTKTNATITANTIVAPDGTLTGDKLVESTAAGTHSVSKDRGASTEISGTVSIYLKAGERTKARLMSQDANYKVDIDLINGTVIGTNGAAVDAFSITSVGNGWWRLSITETSGAGWRYIYLYTLNESNSTSYTGDGYSGIYIWGAQLEAGSFPTSYIPTVASQVTRSADSASMTGSNFSSWYRTDQGSFYAEAKTAASSLASILQVFGSGQSSNPYGKWDIRYGSATQISTSGVLAQTATSGTFNKVCFAYATFDMANAVNAAAPSTSTSFTLGNMDTLRIAQASDGYQLNGTIKRIAYYPKRLSNTELQGVTS